LRLFGRDKVAELLDRYQWADRPDLARDFANAAQMPANSRCLELATGEIALVARGLEYLRIFRNENALRAHFDKIVRNSGKVPRTD
jgi:hypothetical protein